MLNVTIQPTCAPLGAAEIATLSLLLREVRSEVPHKVKANGWENDWPDSWSDSDGPWPNWTDEYWYDYPA